MDIGKHTGSGSLVHNGGGLLYDPASGRLLWDGDVYFAQDPPVEQGEDIPGSMTTYWPLLRVWGVRRRQTQASAGFGYAGGEAPVAAWLSALYGDGLPGSQEQSWSTTADAYANCSASQTTASFQSIALCAQPSVLYFHAEGSPVYDSFTLHHYRFPFGQSGAYTSLTGRVALFDSEPAAGFHGGTSFVRASGLSNGFRSVVIPVNRTFAADEFLYGTDIPHYAAVEIRPDGLPFKVVSGGSSASMSIALSSGYGGIDPSRVACAYGTLTYHYPH